MPFFSETSLMQIPSIFLTACRRCTYELYQLFEHLKRWSVKNTFQNVPNELSKVLIQNYTNAQLEESQ